MNRVEFGQLVAALRKEHLDEDGNRWTQDKLGRETGLGEVAIGKIERGERANFDEGTLLKLADALQLTSMERKEFFLAASGIDSKHIARESAKPRATLDDLLQTMEGLQLPAFIDDSYSDVVAANSAIIH